MAFPQRVVLFQTAFPGDVILTLPVAQVLHAQVPGVHIEFVAIPAASNVLEHHPAVDEIITFDKRGTDKGVRGMITAARRLRSRRFDVAVIPHRSLRSALVCRLARIPRRIGFSTSAGRMFLTDVVPYKKESHEIRRNLDLLKPLGVAVPGTELPALYPDAADHSAVENLLQQKRDVCPSFETGEMIALAPGSVWNTKRWPKEHFIDLAGKLLGEGISVALIGGAGDRALCGEIEALAGDARLLNAAGKLSLLQSAELISRCRVLVTNDSAPMHLAVGVRTPVVAIFGATVPEFGFAPLGSNDAVVETRGLSCRPCSIHGGDVCPIRTFECMKRITAATVLDKVHTVLSHATGD